MNRVYSFNTTIICECCGNPDWEVKATAIYTSEWTVEDVQATAIFLPLEYGGKIELSVAQGDRLVTQAAEHWEDAKKEFENAVAEQRFEMRQEGA